MRPDVTKSCDRDSRVYAAHRRAFTVISRLITHHPR